MSIRAIHFNLAEHRERHIVLGLDKFFNLLICACFLSAKLIARKSQDNKTLILVLFKKCLKLGVRLGGQSSFACNIDNQAHFPFELAQRHVIPINVKSIEFVNG